MASDNIGSVKAMLSPAGGLKMTIRREKPSPSPQTLQPPEPPPADPSPPSSQLENEWITESRGSGIGKLVLKRKSGCNSITSSPVTDSGGSPPAKKPSPNPRNVLRLTFVQSATDGTLVPQIKSISACESASSLPPSSSASVSHTAVDDIASVAEMSPACNLQPSPKDSGIDVSSPPRDDGPVASTALECSDELHHVVHTASSSPAFTDSERTIKCVTDIRTMLPDKLDCMDSNCNTIDNCKVKNKVGKVKVTTHKKSGDSLVRRRKQPPIPDDKPKIPNLKAKLTNGFKTPISSSSSANNVRTVGLETHDRLLKRSSPEESATYNLPAVTKKQLTPKPLERVVLRLKHRVCETDSSDQNSKGSHKKVKIEGGAGFSLRFKYSVRGKTDADKHEYYVEKMPDQSSTKVKSNFMCSRSSVSKAKKRLQGVESSTTCVLQSTEMPLSDYSATGGESVDEINKLSSVSSELSTEKDLLRNAASLRKHRSRVGNSDSENHVRRKKTDVFKGTTAPSHVNEDAKSLVHDEISEEVSNSKPSSNHLQDASVLEITASQSTNTDVQQSIEMSKSDINSVGKKSVGETNKLSSVAFTRSTRKTVKQVTAPSLRKHSPRLANSSSKNNMQKKPDSCEEKTNNCHIDEDMKSLVRDEFDDKTSSRLSDVPLIEEVASEKFVQQEQAKQNSLKLVDSVNENCVHTAICEESNSSSLISDPVRISVCNGIIESISNSEPSSDNHLADASVLEQTPVRKVSHITENIGTLITCTSQSNEMLTNSIATDDQSANENSKLSLLSRTSSTKKVVRKTVKKYSPKLVNSANGCRLLKKTEISKEVSTASSVGESVRSRVINEIASSEPSSNSQLPDTPILEEDTLVNVNARSVSPRPDSLCNENGEIVPNQNTDDITKDESKCALPDCRLETCDSRNLQKSSLKFECKDNSVRQIGMELMEPCKVKDASDCLPRDTVHSFDTTVSEAVPQCNTDTLKDRSGSDNVSLLNENNDVITSNYSVFDTAESSGCVGANCLQPSPAIFKSELVSEACSIKVLTVGSVQHFISTNEDKQESEFATIDKDHFDILGTADTNTVSSVSYDKAVKIHADEMKKFAEESISDTSDVNSVTMPHEEIASQKDLVVNHTENNDNLPTPSLDTGQHTVSSAAFLDYSLTDVLPHQSLDAAGNQPPVANDVISSESKDFPLESVNDTQTNYFPPVLKSPNCATAPSSASSNTTSTLCSDIHQKRVFKVLPPENVSNCSDNISDSVLQPLTVELPTVNDSKCSNANLSCVKSPSVQSTASLSSGPPSNGGKSFITEFAKFLSTAHFDNDEAVDKESSKPCDIKPVKMDICVTIEDNYAGADKDDESKSRPNISQHHKPVGIKSSTSPKFPFMRKCSRCMCHRKHSSCKTNIDIDSYVAGHRRLVRLRRRICYMLYTIVPAIESLQRNMKRDSPKVDQLVDHVLSVLDPTSVDVKLNSSSKCTEPFVDICSSPDQCVVRLQRKTFRLMKVLLPNIDLSDFENDCVDMLEVILDLIAVENCRTPRRVVNGNSAAGHFRTGPRSFHPPSRISTGNLQQQTAPQQHCHRTADSNILTANCSTTTRLLPPASQLSLGIVPISSNPAVRKKALKRQVKDCLMILDRDIT